MHKLIPWIAIAFIAACLGTYLLIWLESDGYLVSLSRQSFWTLQLVMGSAIALAAGAACAFARAPWLITAALLGFAYPCAGYVFIALHQARYSAAYDLLGLSLAIYLGFGLLASFIGASIGTLAGRSIRPGPASPA